MKLFSKLILVILLSVIYVFLINFIASFIVSLNNSGVVNQQTISSGSLFQNVGVSETVNIQVNRNRWYGQILESNEISSVYLFKLFKLPLTVKTHGFVKYHLIFLVIILIILLFPKKRTEYVEKTEGTKFINPFNLN